MLLIPALEKYLREIRLTVARDLEHRITLVTEEYGHVISGTVERSNKAVSRPAKSGFAVARERLSQELDEAMRLARQGTSETKKVIHRPHVNVRSPESVCMMCDHLANLQFHFVRQYQYQLTVDPTERTQNATRGGFCAFHTWLYESVSSPQGVCGGYSPVPLQWAAKIEDLLGDGDHTREHIDNVVKTLVDGFQHCLICELLRTAEADKLEETARDIDQAIRATLCLPHLCKTISRENAKSMAPVLLGEMALTLRRLGEDMGQFALKQAGLRYGWASSAERTAHLNALRNIVGSRSLSYIKNVAEI